MEQVTTDDEPVCVGWEGNNWWWEYRGVTTDDGSIEGLQLIMGLWNR